MYVKNQLVRCFFERPVFPSKSLLSRFFWLSWNLYSLKVIASAWLLLVGMGMIPEASLVVVAKGCTAGFVGVGVAVCCGVTGEMISAKRELFEFIPIPKRESPWLYPPHERVSGGPC